jgi:hypothetical protein
VWVVGGRTVGLEQSLLDLGGRKWRGAYSFFEDPTAGVEALTDEDRLSFAERQERDRQRAAERSERYEGYAANAADRSEAAARRSMELIRPFSEGQPILIGHHSEGAARRDQARAYAAMGRSVAEDAKAEYWKDRAEGAACRVIYSAAYCSRRIKEAESWLRKIERAIQDGAEGERLTRLEAHRTEYEQRKAYWEAERKAQA